MAYAPMQVGTQQRPLTIYEGAAGLGNVGAVGGLGISIPGTDINISKVVGDISGGVVKQVVGEVRKQVPAIMAEASPMLQAEVKKALPLVRSQVAGLIATLPEDPAVKRILSNAQRTLLIAMGVQTALFVGAVWYFTKGPGSR